MPYPEQAYPVLPSRVDVGGDTFRQNREQNLASLEQLDRALAKSREGGGEKYVKRHEDAGKLLPRERIELLLDRDSHFLEIAPLAGFRVRGHAPGASMVGGVGVVSGVECMINASEATVKGGAITELGVTKTRRLADVAESNGLPSINLIESAGADLPNQSKIFVRGGRAFRDLTKRSEARAPTVCLVFGSSTAGGAYVPGMSDYVVMVKEQGAPSYLGWAAAREDGHRTRRWTRRPLVAPRCTRRTSGLSDHLAVDEMRRACASPATSSRTCDWTQRQRARGPDPCSPTPPLHDPDGAHRAARPPTCKVPFDVREVLARVCSTAQPLRASSKPLYGEQAWSCGWAFDPRLRRRDRRQQRDPVLATSAEKGVAVHPALQPAATRPICCIVQNITGFMVGTKPPSRSGIIKDGAKLINAVSNSDRPSDHWC